MSSTSQNVKRAASEPPITLQYKNQIPERAASAEPYFAHQTKRQKTHEQTGSEEDSALNLTHENNHEPQLQQRAENGAGLESSDEFGEVSDDKDSGDEGSDNEGTGALDELPKKKVDMRSEWNKALDNFVKLGSKTGYFTDYLRRKGHDDRPSMSLDERRSLMEELERDIESAEASEKDSSEDDQPESGSAEEGPAQSERCSTPKAEHEFMGSSFAPVDSIHDSASFLNIDISDLGNIVISPLSTLKLRVDQVQNIAFMVKSAEGVLQGAVNSNPHGTGKTIEALACVFLLAQRRQAEPNFDAHKATLILVSHQALRGWQEAHAQFFSSLLKLYICTKSSQHLGVAQKIPLSESVLAETLDGMDSSDPRTSHKVILCTYDDFSSREFLKIRAKEKIVGKKEFSARGSKLSEEAHEALKVGRKPLLFDLVFKVCTLKKIGTLIADEAHEIKDPRTRKAQATCLVDADFNLLLTSSPTDNKISDFRGLLFLLFKPKKWLINWPWESTPEEMLDMYSDTFNPLQGKGIHDVVPKAACPQYVAAMRRGQHLWRLNPHAYRWLGNRMKFNTEFSRVVLGAIFRLVVLRRDPNSTIELPDGSNKVIRDIVGVPPTTIKTVELMMPANQQTDFYEMANPWFSGLSETAREETRNPSRVAKPNEIPLSSFDQAENARLNYVTADFGLSEVFRLPGNPFGSPQLLAIEGQALNTDEVLDAHKDAGMSFYYTMTRRSTDPLEPPPDRVAMIRHLVRRSPKLRWLLVTLNKLKQKKEKAIVFCYHPRTQWLIEGVCMMAEFNFYSLNNTHHKHNMRLKVIADFNDPNKSVDFLLSTTELLGHGYDLSQDCHHMIIFELPHSIPQLLSAVGRIGRAGQTSEQQVSILTLAGSYDDYTLHRQYRKFAVDLWATGIFGRWRSDPKSEVLVAGEVICKQLGSRVNRSFAVWGCKIGYRHGKMVWVFDKLSLERFAADEFEEDTSQGKSLINQIVASRRPVNAHASSGGGGPSGGSGGPAEAPGEQNGEESVIDDTQPQAASEQNGLEPAIDADMDMDVDVDVDVDMAMDTEADEHQNLGP